MSIASKVSRLVSSRGMGERWGRAVAGIAIIKLGAYKLLIFPCTRKFHLEQSKLSV